MPHFLNSLSQAITNIRVKSVIDPLIKLFLLILFFIFLSAFVTLPEWILICFVCFAGFVLLLILIAYACFAIYKPDYLRSESYNLRKQSLSILGDKDNYKTVDMRHVVDIANPYEEIKYLDVEGGNDE